MGGAAGQGADVIEILYILAFLASVAGFIRVLRDPRLSRRFKIDSLLALGAFFAYGAVGVALVIWLALGPSPGGADDATAFLAAGLILAWICLGVLWLTRLAPRTQNPPGWMLRPWGGLDLVLMGTIAAIVVALLIRP